MTFFIYIAISSFAGKWSGQYTGTDQGTWNVTVSDDGEISGTGHNPHDWVLCLAWRAM